MVSIYIVPEKGRSFRLQVDPIELEFPKRTQNILQNNYKTPVENLHGNADAPNPQRRKMPSGKAPNPNFLECHCKKM